LEDQVKDILKSGKRDKTEIIAAIIAMTQKPSKITRIMNQVNLSYPMLKKYMKLMLRLRFVESLKRDKKADETRQLFQATEKGLTFLNTYCDLLRIIYGEDFLQKHNNLAVACLKYCEAR
jgi:predicted transcriptional regulator